MTQENKELLLKDLCGRLPYGVKVEIKLPNQMEKTFESHIGVLKELSKNGEYLVNSKGIDYRSFYLDIKPYLRPMSSMTEEEKIESLNFAWEDDYGRLASYNENISKYIDWLNAHHFDYRGLIEKGLALEAPEEMYGVIIINNVA